MVCLRLGFHDINESLPDLKSIFLGLWRRFKYNNERDCLRVLPGRRSQGGSDLLLGTDYLCFALEKGNVGRRQVEKEIV